jgi:hypothetical protein
VVCPGMLAPKCRVSVGVDAAGTRLLEEAELACCSGAARAVSVPPMVRSLTITHPLIHNKIGSFLGSSRLSKYPGACMSQTFHTAPCQQGHSQ